LHLRRLAAAALVWLAAGAQAGELQARSADGRWILATDDDRRVLLAIDARTGVAVRRIVVGDRGGTPSRIARVTDAAPRRSFIALLADVAEAWELSYDPGAEPVYGGLVHDYRMGEGLAESGPFPVRRVHLDVPLVDVLFAPGYDYFVGHAGPGTLHVVSLAVRRRIETIRVDGDVKVARGISWQQGGSVRFALPDRSAPVIHVLDGAGWRWRPRRDLPAAAVQLRIEDPSALVADLANGTAFRMALDSP
jgi:hypothetical protein